MIPEIITGGAQLGSAAIGSYGGKKAAQAQERSNAAALAYTKQKDALTRQDALRHEALWQTQQNQWRNAANQALANWGFSGTLAPISGYGPQTTPMGSPGMNAMPDAAVRRPASKNAYADLVPGAEGGGRDLTNELGDWSDWRRYNLG